MGKKQLIPLAIALLLAALAFLGPQWLRALSPPGTITLDPVPCDLNKGPCQVRLPDQRSLSLEITPRPIPTLKPLNIALQLDGQPPKDITLDFSGQDMDMGFNRVTLKPGEGKQYTATGSLPICVRGAMAWQALVMVQNATGEQVQIPFHFSTE